MSKADKRTGRKTVRERFVSKGEANIPTYSLEDAFALFLNVKRACNLKSRTLRGYEENLCYFPDWIQENYKDINVNDIHLAMLRKYVLWCANERQYYSDHPYKSEWDKERQGLSPASVNVRIRVLKTPFSTLKKEGENDYICVGCIGVISDTWASRNVDGSPKCEWGEKGGNSVLSGGAGPS